MTKASVRATLVLLICAALAASASANTIEVPETELERGETVDAARFAVNEELGRAWVEVVVRQEVVDEAVAAPREEIRRVQVPGLRYDRATGEVRFGERGHEVTCGVARRAHGALDVQPVNGCRLVTAEKPERVDDGFELRSTRVVAVRVELPRT